jgi:hypothetical protein
MPFTIRPFQYLLPLVCRSSTCALITLLLLSASPVYAEWVALEDQYQSPGLQTLYIDPDTLRREGNLVTLEMLVDWNWMQGNRSPTRFYSTKNTKEFDCAGKRVRSLASVDFYGHMGTGRPVSGGAFTSETYWAPIEPGSLHHGLWAIACGNP